MKGVQVGMRVRVLTGPFAAVVGTVTRVSLFRRHALVALDGISPSIWLSCSLLEPAPPEPQA